MTPALWKQTLRQREGGRGQPLLDRRRLLRRAHRAIRWRLLRAWSISAVAAVALLAGGNALPAAGDPELPPTEAAAETEESLEEPGESPKEPEVPPEVTLEIELVGDGSGRIVSDSEDIDCPGLCELTMALEGTVRLTATAEGSSAFVGWGHEDCPDVEPCELTMEDDTLVRPRFEPRFLLTVAVQQAAGLIHVEHEEDDCHFECQYLVTRDTTVTLRAVELEGSAFQGWDLDVCSVSPECSFRMTDHTTVSAFFHEPVGLTVTIDCSGPRPNEGCGMVEITPRQEVCDEDECRYQWRVGSELTLTAEPAPRYRFLGWRGDCDEASDEPTRTDEDDPQEPCALTMSEERSVTAAFQEDHLLNGQG